MIGAADSAGTYISGNPVYRARTTKCPGGSEHTSLHYSARANRTLG